MALLTGRSRLRRAWCPPSGAQTRHARTRGRLDQRAGKTNACISIHTLDNDPSTDHFDPTERTAHHHASAIAIAAPRNASMLHRPSMLLYPQHQTEVIHQTALHLTPRLASRKATNRLGQTPCHATCSTKCPASDREITARSSGSSANLRCLDRWGVLIGRRLLVLYRTAEWGTKARRHLSRPVFESKPGRRELHLEEHLRPFHRRKPLRLQLLYVWLQPGGGRGHPHRGRLQYGPRTRCQLERLGRDHGSRLMPRGLQLLAQRDRSRLRLLRPTLRHLLRLKPGSLEGSPPFLRLG
mmetsp:Transcript_24037/g.54667  ORF Transcript_24037/g.54667 Transcript_24037/m.54667 type:complete len:297 (+) Transcript_24037:529-1419(+)